MGCRFESGLEDHHQSKDMKTLFLIVLLGYILPAFTTWNYLKPLIDTTGSEYAQQGKMLKSKAAVLVLCPVLNIGVSGAFLGEDVIEFAGDILFDK